MGKGGRAEGGLWAGLGGRKDRASVALGLAEASDAETPVDFVPSRDGWG